MGYALRNFLVPIPSFESFDALNSYLERMDVQLRGHNETIEQLFDVNHLCRFRRLFFPVHLMLLTSLLSDTCPVAGDIEFQDDRVVDHPVNRRGVGAQKATSKRRYCPLI